jgi:hypothetical protein
MALVRDTDFPPGYVETVALLVYAQGGQITVTGEQMRNWRRDGWKLEEHHDFATGAYTIRLRAAAPDQEQP